jgi:hypothetical protein
LLSFQTTAGEGKYISAPNGSNQTYSQDRFFSYLH